MAGKIIFYVCDPQRNRACSNRQKCMKGRIKRTECYTTNNVKGAKLDENGQPIVAMVWEPMGLTETR